jgi:hypothetical protein
MRSFINGTLQNYPDGVQMKEADWAGGIEAEETKIAHNNYGRST